MHGICHLSKCSAFRFLIAECVSALRLKAFRKECSEDEASAAIELIKEDLRGGVLQV